MVVGPLIPCYRTSMTGMRIWYDSHIGDETHYGPQNRNSDSAMELANSPRHQVYDGTFKLGLCSRY